MLSVGLRSRQEFAVMREERHKAMLLPMGQLMLHHFRIHVLYALGSNVFYKMVDHDVRVQACQEVL